MKEIKLTKGKITLVDDEDYDYLNQWKWYYNAGYVTRKSSLSLGKRHHIFIHRVIMNTPDGFDTDHINRNKLDNRKGNLRICTIKENSRNRGLLSRNTSGYKGVSWSKANQKWKVSITVNSAYVYLGYFTDPVDGAHAYDEMAVKLFGEYASLNFGEVNE